MSVSTGDRLGPYAIQDLLGAGGMGEVYRAQDTRLGRSVAVKISAEQFTERFEREARVVASLNHPNICTLFDVGPNYLVMELVDGPTLADRLGQGPIPLEEALGLARQIAEALQAAHEKGIVHRDLKPANIKLKPDGTVKVLDFGLATTGSAVASGVGNADSPTVRIDATEPGMIMGTAGYMAPEQARGRPVDKRADIWAYGVLVYEMLTGRKLFEGETVTDLLAGVLTKEPDLDAVPRKARRLVQSCLQKDPRKRLQDVGDAQLLLEEVQAVAAAPPETRRRIAWFWPAVTGVLAVALLVFVVLQLRRTPPTAEITRFKITLPEKVAFTGTGVFALAPDGRKIVFEGIEGRLWIRSLDSLEVRPVAGSEMNRASPIFWSPDSRSVAYETTNKLRKIDINGGPPQDICDLPPGGSYGGSWNKDNVIIFGTAGAIMRVSAAGGTATPATKVDAKSKEIHLYPSFLRDGSHFLYMRFPQGAGNADAGVYVGSLDSKPEQQNVKALFTTARASIVWVPPVGSDSGRILFWRDNVLYARAFNDRALTLEGEPRAVADQVGYTTGPAYTMASATANTLVYRQGAGEDTELTWLDRGGKVLGTVGEAARNRVLALSRDGSRIATGRVDPATYNPDVWLVDATSGATTRFTFDPATDSTPVWSPDGARVAFTSNRGGAFGFWEKSVNGAGGETLIVKPAQPGNLTDWSRDGRYLIYHNNGTIWVLPLEGDRKPIPFLRSNFNALGARLSPDGRWIAFSSIESGRSEIYVESFTPAADAGSAATTGKWMVSRGGGSGMIHWRQDGKELFYLGADGNMMAVAITPGPAFQAGTPQALFKTPDVFIRAGAPTTLGDVSPDGQRFLLALRKGGGDRQEFTVVMNWDAAPKK